MAKCKDCNWTGDMTLAKQHVEETGHTVLQGYVTFSPDNPKVVKQEA